MIWTARRTAMFHIISNVATDRSNFPSTEKPDK